MNVVNRPIAAFVRSLAVVVFAQAVIGSAPLQAADEVQEISILYLEQQRVRPPVLSNLIEWPEDEGELGAALGIADNNTTGKFLKQNYTLEKIIVNEDTDVVAAAKEALQGQRLVVTNMPAEKLNALRALPEADDDLFFNAGSALTELRDSGCYYNVLHTLPSRAMLTDALMQFLNKRKWNSVFLVTGNRPGDELYASNLKRSANKYRVDIDHEKQWLADADMRRNAAAEIPLLTQARKYDVVVVADEDDDFGAYVLYNTWLPRPVAGTAGVEPVAWSPVVEQWGALQLQSRFNELSGRGMTSIDYAAWAAVRAVGEAVTRVKDDSPSAVREYLFSDKFSLAAFKGAKLTFRPWNGQLRQPVPLVHPQSVVALAPIEGFLHQTTELDTLGLDAPESNCNKMETQ